MRSSSRLAPYRIGKRGRKCCLYTTHCRRTYLDHLLRWTNDRWKWQRSTLSQRRRSAGCSRAVSAVAGRTPPSEVSAPLRDQSTRWTFYLTLFFAAYTRHDFCLTFDLLSNRWLAAVRTLSKWVCFYLVDSYAMKRFSPRSLKSSGILVSWPTSITLLTI